MPKPTTADMLMPIWRAWHGIIPAWAAKQKGVKPNTLAAWARRNPDVDHLDHGVYAWYPDNDDAENIDWDLTRFARALAYAGPDAYLWGPTVLELNHIGTYTSRNTCIATPTRRRVKQGVTWKTTVTPASDTICGMPSQTVFEALTSSRGMFDNAKYRQALDDAVNRHLIDDTQRETLGYSLKRHPADLPRR